MADYLPSRAILRLDISFGTAVSFSGAVVASGVALNWNWLKSAGSSVSAVDGDEGMRHETLRPNEETAPDDTFSDAHIVLIRKGAVAALRWRMR